MMKKLNLTKIHFPTALGLFILLVAVGVGVYLVQTRTSLDSGAEGEGSPQQVRITNITEAGFSVSWLTDKEASGRINLGTEPKSLKQQVLDEKDKLTGDIGKYEAHYVTVKELKPSTKYYFKILSNNKQYDNNGKLFELTTGTILGTPPAADPVYGKILTPSGTAAEGTIVYLNVAGGTALSALAKNNGNWALSLSTARTADLGSYLSYDSQATIVNIQVQGGKLGTAEAVTTTSNDSPVPDITLGQTYDFRTMAGAQQTLVAENAPEEGMTTGGGETSGFELGPITDPGEAASPSGEVSLDNPSFNGEVINATQPAFIGTGPPGTVLSIEINSETQYTGSATIDENGEWEFSPPEGLEPGEHTVTIAYIDSTGEEQTVTRNFVIAAAGESDEPAITATPSGEIEASPTARTSMPATDTGVPEPGSLTPTWLLLIMGLGFLIGGGVLKIKD